SKSLRAWLLGVLIVIAVNFWVGTHLATFVNSSALDECFVLERRIAAYPDKQAVKVVVFGNSHALAGLRPPLIARALALPPNAVFSFALPGGPPQEMRLLAERYLSQFPNARMALCSIDEPFLVNSNDYRMRYWTRGDLFERTRYATSRPGFDERLGLLLSCFVPIADFVTPIQEFLAADPRWVLHNILRRPVPSSYRRALLNLKFPWGLSPPWDCLSAPDLRRLAVRAHRRQEFRECATGFMANEAHTPQGLESLEALAQTVNRHRCQFVLVGIPYPLQLSKAIQKRHALANRDYENRVASFLKAQHQREIPAPPPWENFDYYDTDHLNPQGAKLLAEWVRRHLDKNELAAIGVATKTRGPRSR
ncbi:MAG TPA: hypothetical protein V6D47_07305, partial [Oscillatoriaceae cyanobacterium]